MKNVACALLSTLVFCGAISAQRLQDVKTIFVAPLTGENAAVADMLSAKLISHLAKDHEIVVVESEDKADAILLVTGILMNATNSYGRGRYHITAGVRLTNKEDVVLWADDVASSPFARSATSSFADNVAKKLLQAISTTDRRK